jgi:hypothetical protein
MSVSRDVEGNKTELHVRCQNYIRKMMRAFTFAHFTAVRLILSSEKKKFSDINQNCGNLAVTVNKKTSRRRGNINTAMNFL